MSGAHRFRVDESACIRCGACAVVAPDSFTIGARSAQVARQPSSAEHALCEAALLTCPTSAIQMSSDDSTAPANASDAAAPTAAHVRTGHSYLELTRHSEAVRWRLDDIAWADLDPRAAPPELRSLVRQMAFSEHTTYSATQRFMQAFGDDVELSKWLSVWFYEETRHPQVLENWLAAVGEPVGASFVLEGRVSTPFMKSKVGTLVTNVISEVTAAHAYAVMAATTPEPVLADIARRIAGDEARHAASFFAFARARIDGSSKDRRPRLDALKVLHFWVNEASQVTHPINQMIERVRQDEGGVGALAELRIDFDSVARRVIRLVGILLDLPLRQPSDVLPALQELVAGHHAERVGSRSPHS